MKYVVGTHLDHKSVSGFMFTVVSYNEATNEYTGKLYKDSYDPEVAVLPANIVDLHYGPTKHKYKVGDILRCKRLMPDASGNLCVVRTTEILSLGPKGTYECVTFDGDTNMGIDRTNDKELEVYEFKHINPAPPEPVGCKHEMVDIGVRHTRMVCKLCDHEENVH